VELTLTFVGLDVLAADADAPIDPAFRLSGVLSGQVAVRLRPEDFPVALQPFAAGTQAAPLLAWVCCQQQTQAPSKLHVSMTHQSNILYYTRAFMRQLLRLIDNEALVVTGTWEGWDGKRLIVTLL
jgi:hypothetical protein